ncbi:hypothetical protein LTR66_017443 [Elasticomyces elasticus]|nr:hypothetical protein LTR66_017443 [Elasticomyces elasticus]
MASWFCRPGNFAGEEMEGAICAVFNFLLGGAPDSFSEDPVAIPAAVAANPLEEVASRLKLLLDERASSALEDDVFHDAEVGTSTEEYSDRKKQKRKSGETKRAPRQRQRAQKAEAKEQLGGVWEEVKSKEEKKYEKWLATFD